MHFVRRIRPRGVIALNIMRDQMDRFGEINTTARLVGKTTAAATEWVVLNANDPLISGLSADVTAPHTYWFGHSEKLMPQFLTDDQMHRLEAPTYFVAAEPDACLLDISGNSIRVNVNGTEASFDLKLDGSHNAINLAAVLAALEAVLPDASTEVTKQAIEAIEPAFGRGERITLNNGATLRLQLVKNPGGFTHALSLLDTQDYDAIGIAINDDYADGRDMSWLWDVDFEAVRPLSSKVICGGTRGHDMAVRLKYDDVSTTNIATDNTKFLELLTAQMQTDAIIFCTYTSMLQLRSLLKKYSSELERVEL
ncbi:MAG: Mur ligase [Candidatus Saccharibacteria bacterium]|nr:Mur ligase [Candidatus Saccharibacteria bacterium]